MSWFTIGNVSHVSISKHDTYTDQSIDLSDSPLDTFLIVCTVIFAILLLITIIAHRVFLKHFNYFDPNTTRTDGYYAIQTRQNTENEVRQFGNKEGIYIIWEQLTITENIYEILMDTYSIPKGISDIIISDYCGFSKSKMNPKPIINNLKRGPLYRQIIILILICSLLVATYCGIIFIIQNTKNMNKYNIVVNCEIDRDVNITYQYCRVLNDTVYRNYQNNPIAINYTNFYEDIWIPYLEKYEPTLVDEYSYDLYLDVYHREDNYIIALLYLSENGLADCEYMHSYSCCNCACGKMYCSCVNCCTVFAIILLIVCIGIAFIGWGSILWNELNANWVRKQFWNIIKQINEDNVL
eukprot:542783_1